MIRIGTQMTFCSPEKILKRTAVELDDQDIVAKLFSLEEGNVESSQTLFYDGILSTEIVSVKLNTTGKQVLNLLKKYQYYDFSESQAILDIVRTDKPLLLDFGTNSPDKINAILPHLAQALDSFSIFEIIAACTYYPAVLLGKTTGIKENNNARLLLWENVDLIQKKLTVSTCVRRIN